MSQILDQIIQYLKLEEFEKIKTLKVVSEKTGIKVPYIVLGSFGLILLLVLFNYGSQLLSSVIGFLYPAYMSFKTIEDSSQAQDSRHWLTYWLVYSFIVAFDPFLSYLFIWSGSLYTFGKIGLFIYLFHPSTKGAAVIYDKFLRDLLKKYENHIDEGIQNISESIGNKVASAKPYAKAAQYTTGLGK